MGLFLRNAVSIGAHVSSTIDSSASLRVQDAKPIRFDLVSVAKTCGWGYRIDVLTQRVWKARYSPVHERWIPTQRACYAVFEEKVIAAELFNLIANTDVFHAVPTRYAALVVKIFLFYRCRPEIIHACFESGNNSFG